MAFLQFWVVSNGAADQPRRAVKPQDDSQPRHHLLHPFLPDVGVHLGGGDALVAEQRLDVHPLGSGVQEMGGVGVAPLVRADLLVDAGLLEHPPPGGPRRLGGHRLLPRRTGSRRWWFMAVPRARPSSCSDLQSKPLQPAIIATFRPGLSATERRSNRNYLQLNLQSKITNPQSSGLNRHYLQLKI